MSDFDPPSAEGLTPPNPFTDDVFVDLHGPLSSVSRIHHESFSRIVSVVESLAHGGESGRPHSTGRTLLITAPRSGYGKSHLSARLREHLRSVATSLTLPLDPSRPASWPVALSSVLRQFCRETGIRSGANSQFEEAGRYLLAQVVLSHLAGGRISPDDCPADASRLRSEFAEIFSSEATPKMLTWIDERSRELSQHSSPEFLGRLGLSKSELSFWTRLVIDFNLRGDSALEPLRGLSNGEARERLLQWLRIATFYRPVLLVVDGLDSFHRSETAGMEIAAILTGIRDAVPRSVTVLALNEDVWKSVFQDSLPSAWIDRLSGEQDFLYPIEPESARELVKMRLAGCGWTPTAVARFVERLDTDHLWIDPETRISPRIVLRQARELWETSAHEFREIPVQPVAETAEPEEKPLSELTDKAAFFQALQDDYTTPKDSNPSFPDDRPTAPPPIPAQPAASSPPENPFFSAEPNPISERNSSPTPADSPAPDQLAGIDSIIADIRGTGNTVVSETSRPASATDKAPPSSPSPPKIDREPSAPFNAGDLRVAPVPSGFTPPRSDSKPSLSSEPTTGITDPKPESQVQRTHSAQAPAINFDERIRDRENELFEGPPLQLDLERIERLLRSVGSHHPGLSQREERFASSRTTCLRWNVRGQSVLIGFESPRNVYFWNNLLQRSLATPESEKIAAFTHETEPFDPSLFASFGFSPTVTNGRIDIIKMNDRELAMVYAAEDILAEASDSGAEDYANQVVTRYLDPLWRRISKPI